jgi:hypothetical protein
VSTLISDEVVLVKGAEKPLAQGPLSEEDWGAQETKTVHRPELVPPSPHLTAVAEEAMADPDRDRILSSLLRMADAYGRTGGLHQALELYFTLMREHDGTTQALDAEERVLKIAKGYEQSGELRQARSIYEQLL